jgi:lactoylglutathione lyase
MQHLLLNYLLNSSAMKSVSLLVLLVSCTFFSMAQSTKTSHTRFNHLAFVVKDLKRSTLFYTRIMGLDTLPEPFRDGKHTWLKISENGSLHLIESTDLPSHVKGSHLCFSVPSVENFMEKLQQAHIAFENWEGQTNRFTLRADGVKQVYLRDPDGYWLEVNDDL